MFKYTIQAYNQVAGAPVNIINVTVTSANERAAIESAKLTVGRDYYVVIAVEVLSVVIQKQQKPSLKKG